MFPNEIKKSTAAIDYIQQLVFYRIKFNKFINIRCPANSNGGSGRMYIGFFQNTYGSLKYATPVS